MNAIRNGLLAASRSGGGSHAGLLLSRYLPAHDNSNENKRRLLQEARTATGKAQGVYALAFERWKQETLKLTQGVFRVRTRMITGLGAKGVLETGIRLHHTYGTPLIPGSGLKGLAAHFCEANYSTSSEGPSLHETLFGSTGYGGHITFQDAWILPECLGSSNRTEGLLPDVMTSHHPNYYSGADTAPHDAEDPNPVIFLSVRGRFRVVVECDVPGPEGDQWAGFALRLLTEALDKSGVGGKTGSGYGRMSLEASRA